jgi:hypothetical protein
MKTPMPDGVLAKQGDSRMSDMKNELTSTAAEIDSFDGYEEDVEGQDDQSRPRGSIEGDRLVFTNEATWLNKQTDELIPPDQELIVAKVKREVNKWGLDPDKAPLKTIEVASGEKWPDIEKMNKEAPRGEWRQKFGKSVGPYEKQRLVYLWDPVTFAEYTWTAGDTDGGQRCIEDLNKKIKMGRKFHGKLVFAVVTLSDTFMPTQFGGRQRPHLIFKRFVCLDGGDGAALPEAPPPLISPPADEPEEPVLFSTAVPEDDAPPPWPEEIVEEKLAPVRRSLRKRR